MSFDEGRLNELKSALDSKMSEQQQIADSMQFEDNTLIADDEKKSAFQNNMAQIREIKGLIEDMTALRDVSAWSSEAEYKSVAAEVAASSCLRRAAALAYLVKKRVFSINFFARQKVFLPPVNMVLIQ